MRALSIVADQEGAAVFEPPVNVNDRNARAGTTGDDTITGLENEAAELGHPRIVRPNGRRREPENLPGAGLDRILWQSQVIARRSGRSEESQ